MICPVCKKKMKPEDPKDPSSTFFYCEKHMSFDLKDDIIVGWTLYKRYNKSLYYIQCGPYNSTDIFKIIEFDDAEKDEVVIKIDSYFPYENLTQARNLVKRLLKVKAFL